MRDRASGLFFVMAAPVRAYTALYGQVRNTKRRDHMEHEWERPEAVPAQDIDDLIFDGEHWPQISQR